MPTDRSMASSRRRSRMLVEMVLKTLATAISEIMAMKAPAKTLAMKIMFSFCWNIDRVLYTVQRSASPAPARAAVTASAVAAGFSLVKLTP